MGWRFTRGCRRRMDTGRVIMAAHSFSCQVGGYSLHLWGRLSWGNLGGLARLAQSLGVNEQAGGNPGAHLEEVPERPLSPGPPGVGAGGWE